jgi:hypothetical protein
MNLMVGFCILLGKEDKRLISFFFFRFLVLNLLGEKKGTESLLYIFQMGV